MLYTLKIVEGKDHPKEITDNITNATGKKNYLFLHLKNMHETGKVFVVVNGFCIIQELIELRKVGVFVAAVIKTC